MSIQAKPLHSVGVHMKRKEDPRFLQGKGHYVDDLSFPGMLYLSLVRSTYPHAEITNIDISEAMKVPGVKAVITGKDLEAAGLGWLPTFHGFDKQMVLAIGKVLFQYQEVAAVFAETRAAAVDGAEAVQVDYAPLPVVADPFTSKTDKTLLRPDRESKTNHIFHWEVGDKEGTARAMASSPKRIKQRLWFQRCHPAPLEPCGCVAYFDTMGRLQFHVTSQAPHVYRTALSLVTGIPEDKIHVISPDLGGGFGNKVPVYPGYVCAIVGALKIGRPVKWIETRTENLTSTGFARDYHMDVEIGATADGKVTALHVATTADHGAFDAAADPTKYPAGIFGIVTGSYSFPVAHAEVDAYFTNKAPGGIAYRCSFRVTEASYAIERGMDILADELGHGCRGAAQEELHPEGSVPVPVGAGVHLRQRRLSQDARRRAREDRIQRALKGAGGEARAWRADGHRLLDLHRGGGRRAVEALRHPRHQDVRQRRDPHPSHRRRHRAHWRQVARAGARNHMGADRRRGTGARSRRPSWSRKAIPIRRRTASARTRAAARRLQARPSRWRRAAFARRRARLPRIFSKWARATSSGPTTSSR